MKKLLLILATFLIVSNVVFASDKVNVYYFHGKPRCTTCMKIEKYTQSAVSSMKDKDVIYQGIDMERPENASMVKKYNLFTKSVIVSKSKNGKEQWKNLDKIWVKVNNQKDFENYIITEIKKIKGK